jgi:hypothetical protein
MSNAEAATVYPASHLDTRMESIKTIFSHSNKQATAMNNNDDPDTICDYCGCSHGLTRMCEVADLKRQIDDLRESIEQLTQDCESVRWNNLTDAQKDRAIALAR